MQVHNMLESKGKGLGYISGNIKLVRIRGEHIEVYKRSGQIIKFRREVLNEDINN